MDFPLPSLSVRRLVALALGVALLLVVAVRHFGGGRAAAPVVPVRAGGSAPAAPAAKQVVVDVAGAVRRPGLYHLRDGMRIADAVAAAGGATAKAELDAVNLAAPIADGEQVLVPAGGAAGAAVDSPPAGSSPNAPLDLNSATAEQLDALPGIGPATAQKIVDYRTAHGPFHSVDELDAVPGIGAGRIAQLHGLVIP